MIISAQQDARRAGKAGRASLTWPEVQSSGFGVPKTSNFGPRTSNLPLSRWHWPIVCA